MMQSLGRVYVHYINKTYRRTGSLWEGRFKSTLVDSERYFLTVSRYIELNPVRAAMVEHPSEYPWSSYRVNATGAGSSQTDSLIQPHASYLSLGPCNEQRTAAYRSLFDGQIPERTLAEIREATNKLWVLGDGHFESEIQRQTARRLSPLPRGGDHRSEQFRQGK